MTIKIICALLILLMSLPACSRDKASRQELHKICNAEAAAEAEALVLHLTTDEYSEAVQEAQIRLHWDNYSVLLCISGLMTIARKNETPLYQQLADRIDELTRKIEQAAAAAVDIERYRARLQEIFRSDEYSEEDQDAELKIHWDNYFILVQIWGFMNAAGKNGTRLYQRLSDRIDELGIHIDFENI
jgi:hypothetical protein